MDLYVVRCGTTVVGVSARLQGAEMLKADYGRQRAEAYKGADAKKAMEQWIAACTVIENHHLRDLDD